MERIFSFFLSLVLAASCAACGSPTNSDGAPLPENGAGSSAVSGSDQSSGVQNTPEGNTGAETGGRVLVAYFSATGNTENVANFIAEATGGDLFAITPAEPYTDEDLNWSDENSRVVHEYENPDERDTELVAYTPENWEDYDVVFVGYPIWWYDAAWPVEGFVEGNDFTGKTVIPFCTSSSSDIGESGRRLAGLAGTWRLARGTAVPFRRIGERYPRVGR